MTFVIWMEILATFALSNLIAYLGGIRDEASDSELLIRMLVTTLFWSVYAGTVIIP